MNIVFITNFCAHYRVKTFETLAKKTNVEFIFFSDGGEKYWDARHGVKLGKFRGGYLTAISLLGIRITPALVGKLLLQKYDVVIKCIGGRFALPVTYLIARLRRKPFILWTNLWYHPRTLFHKMSLPLTRWIYRHSDAVVAFGFHVKDYLMKQQVAESKIFISSQTIDANVFGKAVEKSELKKLRERLLTDHGKAILFVGRFDPIKGLEYLMDAFETVSSDLPAKLIMVGRGSEKKRMEALVSEKRMQNKVSFEDYVPNAELPKYYALANVLVLPSINLRGVKEVWGLVINEAMNQGCPVITTDCVGAAAGGLVQDGKTGYIVPERNSSAIASALRKILSSDGVEQKMRETARDEIRHWTYDRQVQGFTQAIEYVSHGRA